MAGNIPSIKTFGGGVNAVSSTMAAAPSFGMAQRFSVVVGGMDLGNWSKCAGLKVNWAQVEHRPGDVVNGVWWIPGTTKYETIKLSRGADSVNTPKTAGWLSMVSSKNVPQSGSITLYDSKGTSVFGWELDNAFPISWGIDGGFDAGQSKVALEVLELVHNGFLLDEVKLGSIR